MKKIISLLTTFLIFTLLICGCSVKFGEDTYPTATEKFFINDFADVIDDTAEQEIYSRAVALNDKTTAQVVVVTVDSLNGEEPEDYALNLGREWGVGTKEKNNGVVILFSKGDRQIYIAIGNGLEGALPDSKTGRIIDRYGMSYLKADEFSTGILSITKAIINEVYIEYGIEPEEGYIAINNLPQENNVDDDEYSPTKIAGSWVILLIVVFLYLAIFGRRRRGFIWFGGPGGFGGGGFGGGRGGFGGGGGFSGGGGSFGGGGAGRGF